MATTQVRSVPPRSWRRIAAVSVITFVFGFSLTVLASYNAHGKDPRLPKPGNLASATVVVQNSVVVSATGSIEDRPLYLSSRLIRRCRENGCQVGTVLIPDHTLLTATCFAIGSTMTNLDLTRLSARQNPQRVSSDVWYQVSYGGLTGFVAEVYLTPDSRGGMHLRPC